MATGGAPGKFNKDSILGQVGEETMVSPPEKQIPRKTAPLGGKKMMEDIKSPKIMGPIDELLYLDLVNFRRIDASPEKRAKKIEKKIDLLSREGIDKMIESIEAWRKSPVNKTYISMGRESIERGKAISDIIKERKEKGFNYLELPEFETIMDLNRKLRF